MHIHSAKFIQSCETYLKCPKMDKPEYAFIGRSNVGKSSLINSIISMKNLARVSGKPGKTQIINHFLINESWYLVDLPGYGYAKVSKDKKGQWEKFLTEYILKRENLMCVFVLVDIRLEPQASDVDFMEWLAIDDIPFVIAFTKTDKLNKSQLAQALTRYQKYLSGTWESFPNYFMTSSKTHTGKKEILEFIGNSNILFRPITNSKASPM
ncbi:MAG: ribosome biogenesis GTP-binding protein YihA/YsxC [Bacteroidia bacterium]